MLLCGVFFVLPVIFFTAVTSEIFMCMLSSTLRKTGSQEPLRQIPLSLLHLFPAVLASSPAHAPCCFSFALFYSGIFLLCLHESKVVPGLVPYESSMQLFCPIHLLCRAFKALYFEKNSYVNTITFIIG